MENSEEEVAVVDPVSSGPSRLRFAVDGVRELSERLAPIAVDTALNPEEVSSHTANTGPTTDRVWYVKEKLWDEIVACSSRPGDSKEKAKTTFLTDLDKAYQSKVLETSSKNVRSVCGLPVLSPESKFARVWGHIIMWVDLLYTAFFVPITVGFKMSGGPGAVEAGFGDIFIKYLDLMAGIIFVMAVVLGFHIGFIAHFHLRRAEVTNGRLVARYYMKKGTFAIDIASAVIYGIQFIHSIVFLLYGNGSSYILQALRYLQLLRMVRLVAVFKMVKRLLVGAPSESAPAWIPMHLVHGVIMLYMLYWIINASACLWFFVGSSYSENGLPNWLSATVGSDCNTVQLTWAQPVEDPDCPDPTRMGFGKAYMLSSYWSVTTMTTVGYGDISPTNFGEMAAAMAVMLAGIMSFAILIGSVQEVFTYASQEAMHASQLRGKLYDVDRWIQQRNLTPEIRNQVRRYFYECWVTAQQSYAADEIFNDLPEHLQGVVAHHLTDTFLAKMRIFSDISDDVRNLLASKLVPVSLTIGQDVCDQGEVADRLWILEKGVMVAIYGGKTYECEEAPSIIGETTVLQTVDPEFELRPCGYRATTNCTLWELDVRDLHVVLRVYPEAAQLIHRGVAAHVLERAGLLESVGGQLNKTALQSLVSDMNIDNSRPASPTNAGSDPVGSSAPPSEAVQDPVERDLGDMGSVAASSLMKLLNTIRSQGRNTCSGEQQPATYSENSHSQEEQPGPEATGTPKKDGIAFASEWRNADLAFEAPEGVVELLQVILAKVNRLESRMEVASEMEGKEESTHHISPTRAQTHRRPSSPSMVVGGPSRMRFASAASAVLSAGRAMNHRPDARMDHYFRRSNSEDR